MNSTEDHIENLEKEISELQKLMTIKRDMLKTEIQKDNDESVGFLQSEITLLKEKIILTQVKLRKNYLKYSNRKIEINSRANKDKAEISLMKGQ
jgi:hypothetical protein